MVRAVRRDPAIGLIVQLALLTILSTTVDLGVAGWATGIGYGLIMWAALNRGLVNLGLPAFGPADWVTLTRATLVGLVTALAADSFRRDASSGVLVAIATLALVLDAVDGYVARRTSTSSMLGARFDMEVDAILLLVLSVYVARSMGAWVLGIGAMRYAFLAAMWAFDWMRSPLPPRFWRKVVAATQGVVLVFAAAGVLPAPLAVTAVALALALLIESFGRDVIWLRQHRLAVPTH